MPIAQVFFLCKRWAIAFKTEAKLLNPPIKSEKKYGYQLPSIIESWSESKDTSSDQESACLKQPLNRNSKGACCILRYKEKQTVLE